MYDLEINGETYRDCVIEKNDYLNGGTCLTAVNDEGPVATLTVWLAEPPAPGCVWIKDWSENSGVLDSLEKLNLVERTGRTHPTGWVEAVEVRLLANANPEEAQYATN